MNSIPSIDPANVGTLTGVLREVFNKLLQSVDGMIPALVVAYSKGPPARVQVQPLIMIVPVNGAPIARPQIASIPVYQYGGGGAMLRFNLEPGDLGWIKASDRDISLFLQSYAQARPNTNRLHDFSDSVFHPDVMTGYNLTGDVEGRAILQTKDGTVSLAIWPDRVKITPLLEVDGDIIATGNIVADNIKANSALTGQTIGITGTGGPGNQATVGGDLRVIGNITALGTITPDVP